MEQRPILGQIAKAARAAPAQHRRRHVATELVHRDLQNQLGWRLPPIANPACGDSSATATASKRTLLKIQSAKRCSVRIMFDSSRLFLSFSVQPLRVSRNPGLVEPGLERAVQSKDHEPALAAHGPDPVSFLARGRFRSEPDGAGTVRVHLHVSGQAVQTRAGGSGRLQHRARPWVATRERPEVPGGDALGQSGASG